MAKSFEEYGVVLDRTAKGLGYALISTTRDKELALQKAAMHNVENETAIVRVRMVVYSDWEDLDE